MRMVPVLAAVLVLTGCAADGAVSPGFSGTPTPTFSSGTTDDGPRLNRIKRRVQRVGNRVVGMPEQQAVAVLIANPEPPITVRVVSRDGEQFPVTDDYSVNRVNLWIAGGVVTRVEVY